MNKYAIGKPGERPRTFYSSDLESDVAAQLGDGEVAIKVDPESYVTVEQRDVLIQPDGKSVAPREKSEEELLAESQAQFSAARREAYPDIAEQLDYIYHNGLDAWKQMILEIKEANPKPESLS